jgi:shikimate kinase
MQAPRQNIPVRIVLIGFMGAGKSTVGPLLAKRLGWRFLDADQALEARFGTTIGEIFHSRGEAVFRELETGVVSELMAESQIVLALGGGAVESEVTRSLLYEASTTYTVFLQAPLEVMVDRCERQPGAADRPVLSRRQLLNDRLISRLPHYRRAHLTVNTAGRSPIEVADHIHQILEGAYSSPVTQKAIVS